MRDEVPCIYIHFRGREAGREGGREGGRAYLASTEESRAHQVKENVVSF
jgi:hypothetical protein